jgi:hypothetical protein
MDDFIMLSLTFCCQSASKRIIGSEIEKSNGFRFTQPILRAEYPLHANFAAAQCRLRYSVPYFHSNAALQLRGATWEAVFAIARRQDARASVNQIVPTYAGAIPMTQPFLDFVEPLSL